MSPIPIELHCCNGYNAVKVWLYYGGLPKTTRKDHRYFSPFVDVFFYEDEGNAIREWRRKRTFTNDAVGGRDFELMKPIFPREDFYPITPYYFAGLYFWGPQLSSVLKRFYVSDCIVGNFNHRLEQITRFEENCISCKEMYKIFPFANSTSTNTMKGTNPLDIRVPENLNITHRLLSIGSAEFKATALKMYQAIPRVRSIVNLLSALNSMSFVVSSFLFSCFRPEPQAG
jgi:hypothetical protein